MNSTRSSLGSLTRRAFLALAGCAGIHAQPSRRMNLLFILVDDLGWADVTFNGGDLHETPNLERLARQSVRFTQAYAAAPICSPTRASIMTGKFPARLHMTIWYEGALRPASPREKLIPPRTVANLPHEEYTLAEALHEAGYRTTHIGKWHLGDAAFYPETQGFDLNVGGTFWGAPPTFFYPFRGNKRFGGEFRYVPGLGPGKAGDYLTDRLTDEAIWAIDASGTQPFFVNLWFHTVHTPIEGKPEFIRHFRERVRSGLHHRNPDYAAMVKSMDENVGRLLDHLEQKRILDRTVIVFTSDNGGFINPFEGQAVTDNFPLRSGKGSLYEGGVRVPLLIRWPGVTPAGAVCPEPVCSTDFYPTLMEILGTKSDQAFDGVSLAPLLRDPDSRLPRDELYFHYPHYYPTTTPVSSVRARDWKLLEYHEDHHVELYHLAEDPSETRDLARQNPEKAAELRARLHAWLQRVNAQMPTVNPKAVQ